MDEISYSNILLCHDRKYFITFRGFEGLLILLTPPNGVKVSFPDVTPEVRSPVLSIAIVAEEEQLLTGSNDGGNPVDFRIFFHNHLQFHPRSKSILQTCIHLNREMLLTTRQVSQMSISLADILFKTYNSEVLNAIKSSQGKPEKFQF